MFAEQIKLSGHKDNSWLWNPDPVKKLVVIGYKQEQKVLRVVPVEHRGDNKCSSGDCALHEQVDKV